MALLDQHSIIHFRQRNRGTCHHHLLTLSAPQRVLTLRLAFQADGATFHDESAILESILNHVCLTLSPEDLLQVLPDDGDLALYMSTIEVSMRLDQVREKQRILDLSVQLPAKLPRWLQSPSASWGSVTAARDPNAVPCFSISFVMASMYCVQQSSQRR